MSRYGDVGQQYFDANGKPLSAGLIYSYAPGTSTEVATYSDEAETIANTNPITLSADGRQGNVFFTGQLKFVLKDSAGTIISTYDPVGEGSMVDAFDTYSATATYGVGAFVTGADGFYYKSIIAANQGNEPSVSTAEWMRIRYMNDWNAAYSYQQDDIALHSGRLWHSQSGTNLNNEPTLSSTYWRPSDTELWIDPVVKDNLDSPLALVPGRHYLIDTTGGAVTGTLPAGVVGDAVAFTDVGGVFSTTNLTISPSGAEEIMDNAGDHLVDIDYFTGVLRYNTDKGWIY